MKVISRPRRPARAFFWPVILCLAILVPAACVEIDPSRLGQLLPVIEPEQTIALGTPTPDVPTASPGFGEGQSPILMCTPPACAPGELFACPTGDCPGGCGTICAVPTPSSGPLDPAPADWESLEGWLAALWHAGANPAAVRAALQQAGWQKDDNDWRAADFDGDLRDEWILVLYDPTMPAVPWGFAGDLWIVNDQGVAFRTYLAPSTDIFEFTAPTITAIADLTGDGRPELVADARICGAHTCFGNYRVIGHTPDGYRDLVRLPDTGEEVSDSAIAMSYPDVRLEDTNGDGLVDLVIHGGTIGSAGAGVVRSRTEIWRWDGAAVTLAETILDPTGYRHHILYEANDLMAGGDLERALALYEAAINDGALRNDAFGYSPEETYGAISRFAAFRLILIDLLRGAPIRASERLAWLQASYPGTAAAQAAAVLVSNWTGAANLPQACQAVESAMSSYENPTGALADIGYGNPVLMAGDFCP
jgi:hypothetical protein